MATSLDDLMQEVSGSINPPQNAFRIRELLENENASLPDVALCVEQDPPLAAAVLRMANSSLFSGTLRVGSVTRAVTRLGSVQTAELVAAISVVRVFKGLKPDPKWERQFWQHAAYTAGSARLLAYLAKLSERDSAFTAGLLHNIGELVIASHRPEQAARIREQCAEGGDQISVEQDILGFDHTEVGGSLAQAWALPDVLVRCIRHHHDPSSYSDGSALVWTTHAAKSLAELLLIKSDKLTDAPAIHELTWKMLNLDPADMPDIMRALNALTLDLSSIISA